MISLVRHLLLFGRRPWRQPIRGTDVVVTRFRVMPWDCDLNVHLTNGRYPTWLDLHRTQFFLQLGAAPLFIKQGWRSVLASQSVTFIREIKPLAAVRVEGRVLHWDEKYFYIEHRFLVNGRLHAKALARVAMLHNGKVASFSTLLQAIAQYQQQPYEALLSDSELPAQVMAKMALLDAKKSAEQER